MFSTFTGTLKKMDLDYNESDDDYSEGDSLLGGGSDGDYHYKDMYAEDEMKDVSTKTHQAKKP